MRKWWHKCKNLYENKNVLTKICYKNVKCFSGQHLFISFQGGWRALLQRYTLKQHKIFHLFSGFTKYTIIIDRDSSLIFNRCLLCGVWREMWWCRFWSPWWIWRFACDRWELGRWCPCLGVSADVGGLSVDRCHWSVLWSCFVSLLVTDDPCLLVAWAGVICPHSFVEKHRWRA